MALARRVSMRRRRVLRMTLATLAAGVAGCGQADRTTTEEMTPSATPVASPTEIPQATTPGDSSPDLTEITTPSEPPEPTPTDTRGGGGIPTTASPTPTATATPTPTPVAADQVVTVGPDGSFSFEPETFELATGETVLWVWDSSGHNMVVGVAPDGSDWSGDSADVYGDGHRHTHSFRTAGEYEYYCDPHRNLGMTGSFVVSE
jgi:plastocyanin